MTTLSLSWVNHQRWLLDATFVPPFSRSLENRALAQLLFWRPVPSFQPSVDAMAPSVEMVELQRRAVADAVAAGELGPEADSMETVYLVSTFIAGVLSQAFANEPDLPWGEGRFTPVFPKLMKLLRAAYPPPGASVTRSLPPGRVAPR